MRIAVISNSRWDHSSRFDECGRIHYWIVNDLQSRGVHLILHSGDVYERGSTPAERLEVAAWLQRCASLAPVLICRGDRDIGGDLSLFERLNCRHPVVVCETTGVFNLGGFSVGVIAWSKSRSLDPSTPNRSDLLATAHEERRDTLRALGAEMEGAAGLPRILLSHAPFTGADSELEDLALVGADLYALGHGQEWQQLSIGEAPVICPGSPRSINFEETAPKGYLFATFAGPRLASWERVATPYTRMVRLEGRWRDGQLLGLEHEPLSGAEVLLRYETPSTYREKAHAQSIEWRDRILEAGAVSVKVEEVVQWRGW